MQEMLPIKVCDLMAELPLKVCPNSLPRLCSFCKTRTHPQANSCPLCYPVAGFAFQTESPFFTLSVILRPVPGAQHCCGLRKRRRPWHTCWHWIGRSWPSSKDTSEAKFLCQANHVSGFTAVIGGLYAPSYCRSRPRGLEEHH